MRVEQLLRDGAERFGGKVAFVCGRRQHSYRDLDAKAARLAAALAANGVGRGDRVALFMDNSFEAIVSMFAILLTGGVACPVDPANSAGALADTLQTVGAVGIVTEARLASVAATALAGVRGVKVVVLSGGDRSSSRDGCLNFEEIIGSLGPGVSLAAPAGPEAPAVVLKVAGRDREQEVLSHADLVAAAARSETPADAVVVASLPLSSHYGLYQLLTALKAGATQVLQCASTFRDGVFGPVDRLEADARQALAG